MSNVLAQATEELLLLIFNYYIMWPKWESLVHLHLLYSVCFSLRLPLLSLSGSVLMSSIYVNMRLHHSTLSKHSAQLQKQESDMMCHVHCICFLQNIWRAQTKWFISVYVRSGTTSTSDVAPWPTSSLQASVDASFFLFSFFCILYVNLPNLLLVYRPAPPTSHSELRNPTGMEGETYSRN